MKTITLERSRANGAAMQALQIDREVMRLLSQRYGDGLVYLHDAAERPQYERAVRLGLVSSEGYLTAAGQSLVSRQPSV